MVNTLAPPISFENSPSPGTFASSAVMVDSVTAAPYEGLWIPSRFTRNASIEVSGTFSSFSLGLYGTNAINPSNTYLVTVGGTVTNNDVLGVTFSTASLTSGSRTVSYTVSGSPSLSTIAANLAALINADTTLAALGYQASAASAVVTINFPTLPASSGMGSFTSPVTPLATILSTSSTGTETLTVSTPTTGGVLFATVTASGFTQLPGPMRWVKARLTALSGSNLSAFFAGVT